MTDPARPRLSGAEWSRRLHELARVCPLAEADDQATLLRELHALLAHAPDRSAVCGLHVDSRRTVEVLIAHRAYSAVALDMLAPPTGCMLSTSGDSHFATVLLPGATHEISVSGETLALALVGALASALPQRSEGAMEPASGAVFFTGSAPASLH